MPYTLYLKKGEEKRLLGGHSWVYANEVQKIEGKDKNGSLAEVRSSDGRFIGKGYINHLSKILVRIFIRGNEEDGKALYLKRIAAADAARKKLIADECYRMVFAEADDLPALIIDRYGDIFVMECLSLGVDLRKDMIAECLCELFSPKGIYMRGDAAVRQKEGLPLENKTLFGDVPDKAIIEENGIKMAVDVKRGQKTGPKGEQVCLPQVCGRRSFGLFLQQRRLFPERGDARAVCNGGGHFRICPAKRARKRRAERFFQHRHPLRGRLRGAAHLPQRG